MSTSAQLSRPLIFVGPPRSGVTLISDIIFHHPALCWLDDNFEKHPCSDFQHRLFKRASSWRSNAYRRSALLSALARDFSPSPSEALNFWHDHTRDDIDFFRGFLRGKHATPKEISTIKERLARRVELSAKSKLALRFTGPSRLCFLHSIFPDARFVHVVRDPASTVHSMISTEEWEYLGKHLLWWRGAYSLQELAMYDQLRHHPVAGTAFQLNKLIQTTKLEAQELGIDLLTINYEDFVASPQMVMARVLDHAQLAPDKALDAALMHNDIRCSNKVLKMPATDINTVYTWCPTA